MSSIDKSKVVGVRDEDLLEFTCGICLGIFTEPVVTLCCSQIYCRQCILLWLSNETTCPNDRTYITSVDLVPAPRPLVNLLEKLNVKCNYEELGCTQVVRIGGLSQHIRICEHRPDKPCMSCGLTKEIDKDHDCIKALMAENSVLKAENKRLLDENAVLLSNRNSFNFNLINLVDSRPTLKHILLILGVLAVLFSGLFAPVRNDQVEFIMV